VIFHSYVKLPEDTQNACETWGHTLAPNHPTGAPADVAQMHQGSWDQNRIRRWSPRPGDFCLASNRCESMCSL
jgi:hypothetical protein